MTGFLGNLSQYAITTLDAINQYQGVITAFFTATLWWVTWGMVRIAKDQRDVTLQAVVASRDAANAAMKSATTAEKALIDWERPYLYAEVSHINFKFGPDDKIIMTDDFLRYKLTNYGRTPAQIIEVNATMRNKNPGPAGFGIPRPPHFRMGDVISVNESRDFSLNFMGSMVNAGDMPEWDDLKKTSTIIIMGYVRFFGMSDSQYVTVFCGKYNADSGRFGTYGDTRYNYTKRDDADLDFLRHT